MKQVAAIDTLNLSTARCEGIREKVAVLVSGGVDSAVALTLLKKAGYDVEAFYLKIWLQDEVVALGDCPWEADLGFVRAVTEKLDVRLHVLSLQDEYWKLVISDTIARIKQGETPNPDMHCNSLIKFGVFIDYLRERFPSFTKVASGHYAQIAYRDETNSDQVYLKMSPDAIKDQTYFLSRLRQVQLQALMFPIGHLTKQEVRACAREYRLQNQNRKDSQGLCFLGKIKFRDFVRYYLGEKQGEIVAMDTGRVLGVHRGYWYYTLGQRQGLDLSNGPWYVVAKDIKTNRVYVSRWEAALRKKFTIGAMHWLSDDFVEEQHFYHHKVKGSKSMQYTVKIRHGSKQHSCTLTPIKEVSSRPSETEGCYRVNLNEVELGIAPGQFAVFYKENICVGSAVIVEA
ncbi:tRNA-specific 2-thiouridylase MnmA [Spirochaetota bacterium]|nr:tRNA-specific 2-thiouridylase MnmA [Spirochaetota bacterium]